MTIMKTKIKNIGSNCFKLVIDQPGVAHKDQPVLGLISHFFASNSWSVEDVRLAKFDRPAPGFEIGADRYQACVSTGNEEESSLIRSLLTDFEEKPGKDGGAEFSWCTYDGLVRGRDANEVSSFDLNLMDGYLLFHSRKDALLRLHEMADFWENFPCDAADPDVIQKVAEVKINNPYRQISESMAMAKLLLVKSASQSKTADPSNHVQTTE